MKIIIDTMGYENELHHVIDACNYFFKLHSDANIILVGDKNQITPLIDKSVFVNRYEIVHTEEYVSQKDTVLTARRKINSSMQLACNLLKDGAGDGVLSAGNTAVFVYTAYATIGMIDGVEKIGFMPTIPNSDNGIINMIDVGATLDVNAEDLYKYALMANVYAKQYKKMPRIGVLNIGIEEHKGHQLQHEVNQLLKNDKNLNYIGFIEANNLLNNSVDVVVCDGFTGNIALKACEGSVKTLAKMIKNEFKRPRNFLAALLAKRPLKNVVNKFDYKNHAGAFVMGLKKICVKTHGSADFKQFKSALEMLYNCINNNVIEKIESEIAKNGKSKQ